MNSPQIRDVPGGLRPLSAPLQVLLHLHLHLSPLYLGQPHVLPHPTRRRGWTGSHRSSRSAAQWWRASQKREVNQSESLRVTALLKVTVRPRPTKLIFQGTVNAFWFKAVFLSWMSLPTTEKHRQVATPTLFFTSLWRSGTLYSGGYFNHHLIFKILVKYNWSGPMKQHVFRTSLQGEAST